jgi:hypothetical protein
MCEGFSSPIYSPIAVLSSTSRSSWKIAAMDAGSVVQRPFACMNSTPRFGLTANLTATFSISARRRFCSS